MARVAAILARAGRNASCAAGFDLAPSARPLLAARSNLLAGDAATTKHPWLGGASTRGYWNDPFKEKYNEYYFQCRSKPGPFMAAEKDLESDEALWDLYERCCHHFLTRVGRRRHEMASHFVHFKEAVLLASQAKNRGRTGKFKAKDREFKVKASADRSPEETARINFVWKSHVPDKVKEFGWLLMHDRTKTKANLFKLHNVDAERIEIRPDVYMLKMKNEELYRNRLSFGEAGFVNDEQCEVCKDGVEDSTHLILGCPFARRFWSLLGFDIGSSVTCATLWKIQAPSADLAPKLNAFILFCCYQLWRHRNEVAFNSMAPCHKRLLEQCRKDARLWGRRLPERCGDVAFDWADLFARTGSSCDQ